MGSKIDGEKLLEWVDENRKKSQRFAGGINKEWFSGIYYAHLDFTQKIKQLMEEADER